MTLDDLGNIGEFVGSIGVVVSLVYLAIQIRRDTAQAALQVKATHATAFQNLIDHHSSLQMQMMTNPTLSEAVQKETNEPDCMTPTQVRLAMMFRTQQMRSFFNAYQLFEAGLIDSAALRIFDENLQRVSNAALFDDFWKRVKNSYPESFISHVENIRSRGFEAMNRPTTTRNT